MPKTIRILNRKHPHNVAKTLTDQCVGWFNSISNEKQIHFLKVKYQLDTQTATRSVRNKIFRDVIFHGLVAKIRSEINKQSDLKSLNASEDAKSKTDSNVADSSEVQ